MRLSSLHLTLGEIDDVLSLNNAESVEFYTSTPFLCLVSCSCNLTQKENIHPICPIEMIAISQVYVFCLMGGSTRRVPHATHIHNVWLNTKKSIYLCSILKTYRHIRLQHTCKCTQIESRFLINLFLSDMRIRLYTLRKPLYMIL